MQQNKLYRLLAGAFVAGLLASPASAQQGAPTRSGLPWASGVTWPVQPFAAWRGRPLDLRTVFYGKTTWDHLRASAKTRPELARMAIGFPMLPITHDGQLEQCAAGAFDATLRAVRDNMLASGWKGSFVRLGWEANRIKGGGTGHAFPWAAKGDGSSYVGCFRRWVGILNPGTKNFTIVWNMGNLGSFPHPIAKLYPGNDVVDIVASNFYDRCPPMTTDAEFKARMSPKDRWGNPAGPQAWLDWAKARGKRWALPEWGIGGSKTACSRPGFDNPFFVRKLHDFLRTNAAHVAFETYFNDSDSATGTHVIYPSTYNSKAAAEYRRLW